MTLADPPSFPKTAAAHRPAASEVMRAIVAGLIGACAGGWINNVIYRSSLPVKFPLIPGLMVGAAVALACRRGSRPAALIAAVLGVVGMIISDAAETAPLSAAFWQRLVTFYADVSVLHVVFWILNALVAYYISRR